MAIRRYNNLDFMANAMNDELEELEAELTALYVNAANSVKARFTNFMRKFETANAKKLKLLEQGKITKIEYDYWVRNKVLRGIVFKSTIKALTETLVNTDVLAMALVRGKLPYVIAQTYNFCQSLGWAAANDAGLSVGTFQIYNARAVEKIIRDNPRLLPAVDLPLDQQWNKDRINNVITQGIIQGKGEKELARDLQAVAKMDETAAVRNARTAMTYAENLSRHESYINLKSKGLPVRKKWSAIIDARTRDTHRQLNGTYANEDGLFGEGILDVLLKCPADPQGQPQEIYNCRCRCGVVFDNSVVDHSNDDEAYEQFLKTNYPDDYEKLKSKDYFSKVTNQPQPPKKRK